jgi:mannose-1-phosphate guanylyltransferase
MNHSVYHVIMAGGSGTRFWPASRREKPKQFLTLAGPTPLIRQAFERCALSGPRERIFVSAGESQRPRVLAALPELPASRFIGEPIARNTAPAVGLSALRISLVDPSAVAVFSPADHVYTDLPAYAAAIERAVEAAAGGDLVTLGIRPTRPETGFGYIEVRPARSASAALRAVTFIEKPDAERAATLSRTGVHFWNAGVFIWKVSAVLEAIRRHHPALFEGLAKIRGAAAHSGAGAEDPFDAPEVRAVVQEVLAAQPPISIDYAVMERADNVLVVPCEAGWSDVGSWDAIAELGSPDAEGNVVEGDVIAVGARGNLVRANKRLIALVGVNDLIVIDAGDAVLICKRGDSQKVREIVAELESRGRAGLL